MRMCFFTGFFYVAPTYTYMYIFTITIYNDEPVNRIPFVSFIETILEMVSNLTIWNMVIGYRFECSIFYV